MNYTCIFFLIIAHISYFFNPDILSNFHLFCFTESLQFRHLILYTDRFKLETIQEREVLPELQNNYMPAQDVDELIFGTDEHVIVSER